MVVRGRVGCASAGCGPHPAALRRVHPLPRTDVGEGAHGNCSLVGIKAVSHAAEQPPSPAPPRKNLGGASIGYALQTLPPDGNPPPVFFGGGWAGGAGPGGGRRGARHRRHTFRPNAGEAPIVDAPAAMSRGFPLSERRLQPLRPGLVSALRMVPRGGGRPLPGPPRANSRAERENGKWVALRMVLACREAPRCRGTKGDLSASARSAPKRSPAPDQPHGSIVRLSAVVAAASAAQHRITRGRRAPAA